MEPIVIPLAVIGTWEIVAIVFVVVLLFGAKKIPGLARALGEGIRNFRTGIKEAESGAKEDGADGSKNTDR